MKPESMKKQLFLKELKSMADDLYSHGDSYQPSEIWKQKSLFLDGFVKAGMLFKVTKMSEVQEVIDASHLQKFGEDRELRKLRRSASKDVDLEIDWDKYDSPAFTRENGTSK